MRKIAILMGVCGGMALLVMLYYLWNQKIVGNIIDQANDDLAGMEVNGDDIMKKNLKVVIDNKEYSVVLADNETTRAFIERLPQEFEMEELNGNEKYVYMDYALPVNEIKPNRIEAGDVMLYGENCLVIFYKTFDTIYAYTRIGRIDDLPELGSGTVRVRFELE